MPLTAHGEEEARSRAHRLNNVMFESVLTSPSARARRTCELMQIAPAARLEPRLAEWDYGDYEGQRSADIRKVRPNWNVPHEGRPDGESPAQVSDRADRLIAHLRTLTGNIALFSHGQCGCIMAVRWIGQPVILGENFPLDTLSISIFGYSANHPEVSVMKLFNSR
jgi:broad specificity phosphatase PhoE